MRQFINYLFLILIMSSCAKSKIDELNVLPPNSTWGKKLYDITISSVNGSDSILNNIIENKYAIESLPDNGFVVAVNGYIDFYDEQGITNIQRGYSNRPIFAIERLTSNAYLLGGVKDGTIWISKVDENWNQEWEHLTTHSPSKIITAIEETNDGIVIAGSNGSDCWLMKFNDNGILIWERKFEQSGIEDIQGIDIMNDGNIVTIGRTDVPVIEQGKGNTDIWVLKIDNTNGNILSEDLYGGETADAGFGIKQAPNGDFIFLGKYNSNESRSSTIVRLNEKGKIKTENYTGLSDFFILDKMPGGDWLLVGHYYESLYYGESWVGTSLSKLNDKGERVWQRNFNYDNYNEIESAIATAQFPDGSFALLVKTEHSDYSCYSFYKTAPE